MSSSKVNLTFTGSASPYTAGDKASFPMHVARGFIKRGVAHFTNPVLVAGEKSITRTRLNTADDRPHSVKGQVTSGKDLREYPDEFDMGRDDVNVDDRKVTNDQVHETADDDPNTKFHPEELPKLQHPQEGAGRLQTLDSPGYSTKVGEKSDASSKNYDAGGKSHAEADARNAGLDPAAAGDAQEKERQAAEGDVAKKAKDQTDFSDKGDKTGDDAGLDQDSGEYEDDDVDEEADDSADKADKPTKAGKAGKRKRTRL